jgi:hypothetical protein
MVASGICSTTRNSKYTGIDFSWSFHPQAGFGISASELLVTVVCMIMYWMEKSPHYRISPAASGSVITRAVEAVKDLISRSSRVILRVFADTVCAINTPRMRAPRIPGRQLDPAELAAFRAFICDSLGIPLSAIDSDAPAIALPTFGPVGS